MELLKYVIWVGTTATVSNKSKNEGFQEGFKTGRAHERRENYLRNPAKNILSDKKIQDEIRFAFGYTNPFEQLIIDLIFKKADEDNNENAKGQINLLKEQNVNILDNISEQNKILVVFGYNIKFKPFVKDLILNKANSYISNDLRFENFNSFYSFAQDKYNLSTFIQIYGNTDVSQIEKEEKQSIVSRFELLPQIEKNKFDLYESFNLKNRDLKLLLINHVNINIEITDKNDKLKSYFQYLILDNQEIPNNKLSDYFSQNFANPKKRNIYQKSFTAFIQFSPTCR